jgi:hypothetical protein
MKRPKDLIRRAFGRLTVIDYEKGSGRKPGKYICTCTCGGIKKTVSKSLTSGETKSCGCLQKEKASLANSLRPFEALYNWLLAVANKTSRTVTLSYEDFLEYTKITDCHYCFSEVFWNLHDNRRGERRSWGYNLDRKDNALGYMKDNIVVCCRRCNIGKSYVFSYEEWWKMTECFRKGKVNELRNRKT